MADDAQRMAMEMERTQRRLQAIDGRLGLLEQQLAELDQANTTLSGLAQVEASESLVPIGGGVRLRATVDPAAPVMLDVGAGYTHETDLASAQAAVADRLTRVRQAYQAAEQEAEELAMRFQQQQAALAQSAQD